MAAVVNTLKTLRNNWKKTVFFSGLAVYGVHYGYGKYKDSCMRRAYCLEAKKYGEQPTKTGERLKKLTVFLNPAASKGSGDSLFKKNAAPLLYLAGIEVTVVKTEYEGQAKKYMDVIEKKDVDAFLVVGGDGTLSEVVTGLLRRDDHEEMAKIPVGVIPVGRTNTLARTLFHRGESDVRWMLEGAMAVIRGATKPIDVMQIKGDADKNVYAVTGLEWGAFRVAENQKTKYWFIVPFKDRVAYVHCALRTFPRVNTAELSYVLPCEGCSKCYVAPPVPQWKWWHVFLPPKIEVPKKDYSQVVNEECGKEHSMQVRCLELTSLTQNNRQPLQENSGIDISITPETMSRTEFINEGWTRNEGKKTENLYQQLRVSEFTLQPEVKEEKEAWFTIDNEQFELMPLHVKLLRHKLQVFCGDVTAPTVFVPEHRVALS